SIKRHHKEMISDKNSSVFVCYAEPDRAWVQGYLFSSVNVPGVQLMTKDDFLPGDILLAAFEKAVAYNDYTILVISEAVIAGALAGVATDIATYQHITTPERRVIPLQLKVVEMSLALNVLIRLDYTDETKWEQETARLRRLLSVPPSPPIPKPDC